MARPRFTGQGFTNPLDSLGLNAESRHRAMPPISNAFMSNEAFHAENVSGNQEFHGLGGKIGGKQVKKGFFKKFTSKFGRKGLGEAGEEGAEGALKTSLRARNKALLKQTASPTKQAMIKFGGRTITALAVIGVLGLPLVENLTGGDCPQKAIDAGYEEGTEEHTKFIEDCQAGAANKVMMTGITVIGVVVIIAAVILRPKKSAE